MDRSPQHAKTVRAGDLISLVPPACGEPGRELFSRGGPQRAPVLRVIGWKRRLLALAWAVVFLAVGCGGTFFVASTNGRLLVFVSVTPASIDPMLSSGSVVFTAAGTFNSDPTSVSPLPGVIWSVDTPAFSTLPNLGRATITPDGIAQCGVGFVGTVKVFATAPANPAFAASPQNQTVGTATLICP